MIEQFYKKRYLFSTDTGLIQTINYETEAYFSDLPERIRRVLTDQRKQSRVEQRLSEPDCGVIIALSGNTPVGWAWILVGGDRWHDKIHVDDGDALLFDAYVIPRYRQQGVYSDINRRLGSVADKMGADRLFAVVESKNEASMKAHKKCGMEAIGTNYLVKVFRRNVATILVSENTVSISLSPLLNQLS
jgi:RimJ/RimL family protein N-acetyltransferase